MSILLVSLDQPVPLLFSSFTCYRSETLLISGKGFTCEMSLTPSCNKNNNLLDDDPGEPVPGEPSDHLRLSYNIFVLHFTRPTVWKPRRKPRVLITASDLASSFLCPPPDSRWKGRSCLYSGSPTWVAVMINMPVINISFCNSDINLCAMCLLGFWLHTCSIDIHRTDGFVSVKLKLSNGDVYVMYQELSGDKIHGVPANVWVAHARNNV